MPIAAFGSADAPGMATGAAADGGAVSVEFVASCADIDSLDVDVVNAPLECGVADKGLRWYAWWPCVLYSPRKVLPKVEFAEERTSWLRTADFVMVSSSTTFSAYRGGVGPTWRAGGMS